MDIETLRQIEGGAELVEWFGYAPTFHDAELLSLTLDREGTRCSTSIHAFRMNKEVDARGYFILDRHVIVTFEFEDVTLLELEGFNLQNALYGVDITRTDANRIRVEFEAAYGLDGVIEAVGLRLRLRPGIPERSQYASQAGG